ncbi:DEAD/DEAH box helicase family protein [Tissierella carlieri]|uniref:DEAD/DEAH box helicase family protein n=1 Tax=Tissierella carlieri TaxID=689904 RepID=UPI001C100CE7|nr:DEAD/DEAH box helicase family protein [Tissierella carlieri]MBU5310601.1 DEAD/DEAH box helicase family protein [Tissierella carlieri]
MGDFSKLYLKVHYDTDEDNIVEDFYNVVLKETVKYKRAVAFFNSRSLIEIIEGLRVLIKNNGKILLLISPMLEDKDVEAIKKGYKTREQALEDKIIEEFEIGSVKYSDKYNLLAWLIYKSKLDIKIVYRIDSVSGIFHDKLGILYDSNYNIICFHGSNNETFQAMNSNYESFDVYVSWDSRDEQRIKYKEEQFDRLWDNKSDIWKSFSISDGLKEKLLTYKIGQDPYIKEEFLETTVCGTNSINIKPHLPKWLDLREYQIEAINNWFKNGGKGIFEMATGTGKTITSLAAITKLLNYYIDKEVPIGLIIALPYKVLLEQWEEELYNFNILPLKCYESVNKWKNSMNKSISLFNSGHQKLFCVITTNSTFKSEQFQERLNNVKQDYIICIDEMHNFTSDNSINSLPENAKYRLGLSATLENEYKHEQLNRLKSYFGEGVIFKFTMEEAIKKGFLTKYYYYPVFVELTDTEKVEYYEISRKIGNIIGKVDIEDQNLQALFRIRARIISSAENKVEKLLDFSPLIKNSYNNIFYCGDRIESDGKFIEKVNKVLANRIGIKTHTFTSNESKNERERILNDFKDNKLQALTAIRCLDEGVDIPKLKRAFILSSGSNPKEFIQRRGRVLRRAEGKEYAEIYDFIVIPTLDREQLKVMDYSILMNEKKIIVKELNRFKEFADLAINTHEAYKKIFEVMDLYK